MEIGAAGPIAGFIVAVPTLILGLFLSETTTVDSLPGLTFGSSIILTVLSKLILGVTPLANDVNIHLHPIAFAGWIGAFCDGLEFIANRSVRWRSCPLFPVQKQVQNAISGFFCTTASLRLLLAWVVILGRYDPSDGVQTRSSGR